MNNKFEKQFAFPWYRKGLPFQCTQCGKCCTGSPGYVWVTEDEIAQMAALLTLSISAFKRLYVRRIGQRLALIEKKSDHHSCVFYQNKQCKVYASRPLQCKAYPFWKENLLSEESWKQTAKECEGIQPESPLVSSDVIEQFLEEQQRQNPQEHFVSASEHEINE